MLEMLAFAVAVAVPPLAVIGLAGAAGDSAGASLAASAGDARTPPRSPKREFVWRGYRYTVLALIPPGEKGRGDGWDVWGFDVLVVVVYSHTDGRIAVGPASGFAAELRGLGLM